MDDSDKTKLQSALSDVDSLLGQLSNINKRGQNAVKEWAQDVARSTDKDAQAKLKGKVMVPMVKLLKTTKSVEKDLEALYKEGSDAKKLAAYADGKAFRTKALTKYLVSSKQFEYDALKLLADLQGLLGGGMYPGMGNTDVKATVESIKNFSKYYNAFRIDLAKL